VYAVFLHRTGTYSAFFFSLGSTSWDGLPLHNGYLTRIGGKDVELDSQIKASQIPDIIGSVPEYVADEETAFDPLPPAGPSFLLQALKMGPESPGLALAPKFVAPTSFYGQAAPKPKPKGPLLVFEFRLVGNPAVSCCLSRHDASAADAVVMKSPTKEHAKKHNKKWVPAAGRHTQCTDELHVQGFADRTSCLRSYCCTAFATASEGGHVLCVSRVVC
jgi:hypothetical protein